MIIWWLFVLNYFDYLMIIVIIWVSIICDYLMIICSQLFVIIWWLFDFHTSSLAAGRLASFISESIHTAPWQWWHIVDLVMIWQPVPVGISQPTSCSEKLIITTTHYLVSHASINLLRALLRSARSVFPPLPSSWFLMGTCHKPMRQKQSHTMGNDSLETIQ